MLKNIIREIKEKKGLVKILTNINWLTFEKIFRLALALVIAAWVARYLGPERYGTLNYAIAFAALFSALSKMGLDQIVVRNIVKNPEKKNYYLGSSLFLKFMGSLLLFMLAAVLIHLLKPGDSKIILFVMIIAFGYIFKPLETIDFWFQSQLQSKYTVLSRSAAFFVTSAVKVVLILTHSPLVGFVWMVAVDSLVTAVLLLTLYQRKAPVSILNWKIKPGYVKELLKDSWPLFLSGIAILIYLKIDQVMIGMMINNTALGYYSAAVRISEKWYFIPVVISASVFPSIIKAQKNKKELYLKRFQHLYDIFTWFSISVSLVVMLLSGPIISIIFGGNYAPAAQVLSIHIWAGVFVFLGVASSKYLVAENLTKISLYKTVLGALSNVLLNIILLPRYGIIGAAYATLFSYAISDYFSNLLFPKSRIIFIMFIKSLFPVHYFKKGSN